MLVDFNGRKLEIAALPHAWDCDGLEAVLWHTAAQLWRIPGRFRTLEWKRLARRLLCAAIMRAAPDQTVPSIVESDLLPMDLEGVYRALLEGRRPVIEGPPTRRRIRRSAEACCRWNELNS